MTTECMLKYVEPVIHVVAISGAALSFLPPLFDGGYNAYFGVPACTIIPKPWFCENSNNYDGGGVVECIRGAREVSDISPGSKEYMTACRSQYLLFAIPFVLSFLLMCWRVFYNEKQIRFNLEKLINQNQPGIQLQGRKYGSIDRPSSLPGTIQISGTNTSLSELLNGTESDENIPIEELIDAYNYQYDNTKAIAFQSMLYLSSLGVTCISFVFFVNFQPSLMSWYKTTLFVLTSLQGVENFFIFLFHKVHDIKRSNSDLSTWDAIIDVFKNGGVHDVSVIFSTRIHLLSNIPERTYDIYDGESGSGSESGSVVVDNESDVLKIFERSNNTALFMFETSMKRFSNGTYRAASPDNSK